MTMIARLDRLTKLEKQNDDPEAMAKFTSLDLYQMGETKVDFGEAHVGKTFAYMWDHQKTWIKFVMTKYGNSGKLSHRKLIHYANLRIERAELEQGLSEQITPASKMLMAKPKAKTPGKAAGSEFLNEEDEDLESFIEVDASQVQTKEAVEALQIRMGYLENAIGEILNHIRRPQGTGSDL